MLILLVVCLALAFILAVISVTSTPYSHQLLVGAVLFLALAVVFLSIMTGVLHG